MKLLMLTMPGRIESYTAPEDIPAGWELVYMPAEADDASLLAAAGDAVEKWVFLHYPPIYAGEENAYILEVLRKYAIKRCYYGHVHGSALFHNAFQGERDGIVFQLISADYVKFTPVLVQE